MPDSSWPLDLTQPWLLAGLGVVPVLVYLYRRSLVDFSRWQRLVSLGCRVVILVALVLALAGLTLLAPTHEPFVIFAVDHSKSISAEARHQAEEFIDRALATPGNHHKAFVYFAASPGPVQREWAREAPPLDEDGTNLAAALEVAAAVIPPGYVPHIVLLSDGNETEGDARRAVLRSQVPVSTVPLPAPAEPEVQVSAVNVPPQVREGEPFEIKVVVHSNHEDHGKLQLFRGPYRIAEIPNFTIHQGETRQSFKDTLAQGGLAIYEARVSASRDKLLENNHNIGLVYATGKPHVLMLDSDPAQAKKYLVPALEEEGIQVEVRRARGMPDNLSELQNYELIILSNVPATDLTQQQMELARWYVQEMGGGLLMLGGDQSFGLGGYTRSVLEEILPVRSDFEKEKEKPGLAMVLLIDRSLSMSENQKMELAKEAANGAVALLGPNDQIGVIAFDVDSSWICEVRSAADKRYVMDQISRIRAAGGTHISPAMEMALESLRQVSAKYKHVILLTDGLPNDSDQGDFLGIASSMPLAGITFSTVGIGPDADRKFLEDLAAAGRGRSYHTDDPNQMPQILAKETVTASQSAINERPFVPVLVQRTPVLANLDFATAPELLGYVLTRRKEISELILATEKGDPLLVWGRYGLGMSVAFTSDATSRWAADWITNWPTGYSKFWAQVVRHAMRKNEARGAQVQVRTKGRHTTVTLDAVDARGRFINHAETILTVIDPQPASHRVAMTQMAPGRYVAELETALSGPYHLVLTQKHQGNLVYHQARGFAVGYSEELRLRPTNEALLRSLAEVSGGTFRPEPAAVFAVPERTARQAVPLWPYLVMAAAGFFVIDVALRRIDFAITWSRWRTRRAAWAKPSEWDKGV